MDDAQALLGQNLDLCADLKKKYMDLKEVEQSHRKAEGAWKEVEELTKKNFKKLEESRSSMLACMEEAKVGLNVVFAKAGVEQSEVLLDVDPTVFSAWL